MSDANGRAAQLIPLPSACFLQVQENCDYDLVTPLALLFYYAVLYVSPEAAARILISVPGQTWGLGLCSMVTEIKAAFVRNITVCFDQSISQKKILYESTEIKTRQQLHKLRDEKMSFSVLNLFI